VFAAGNVAGVVATRIPPLTATGPPAYAVAAVRVSCPAPALVNPNPLLLSVIDASDTVTPVATVNVGAPVRVAPVKDIELPELPLTATAFAATPRAPNAIDVYPVTSSVVSAVILTALPGVRPAGAPVAVPFRRS
jgi:hypothetical protein